MDAELITLFTALATLATAGIGLVIALRKIQQVHVIVNSRMTRKLNRIEQLTTALLGEGVQVPEDPDPDDATA